MMPMGPAPVIKHVLAHAFKGQRGVDGVAEGIKRCSRGILVHAVAMMPDVRHRHADVFGEGPGAVHADADGVFAKMPAAGEAVAAAPADDVALGADDLARMEVVHVRADATISPTNSCPTTIGTGIVFCAQASHL
jgi:hypothetical protein